jgi:hypothetical protein
MLEILFVSTLHGPVFNSRLYAHISPVPYILFFFSKGPERELLIDVRILQA